MQSEKDFLENYDITAFERPSVTTDIVCFRIQNSTKENYRKNPGKKLTILLIQRKEHPFMDAWALPGGFLQPNETIEQCAMREISGETGITPVSIMPVCTFSEPGRDPRGWIISNAFASILGEDSAQPVGGDDAKDAKWFEINFEQNGSAECILELTHSDITLRSVLEETKTRFGIAQFAIKEGGTLAFDHARIIATTLSVLREKAKHFEYIFDFLPETFTLNALQKVQETIMDIEVLPANFRRKVAPFVAQTDDFTQGDGHRPAQLYKRNTQQ